MNRFEFNDENPIPYKKTQTESPYFDDIIKITFQRMNSFHVIVMVRCAVTGLFLGVLTTSGKLQRQCYRMCITFLYNVIIRFLGDIFTMNLIAHNNDKFLKKVFFRRAIML